MAQSPKQTISSISFLRKVFKVLNLAAPFIANRLGARLFFSPMRYKMPYREKAMYAKATKYQISSANHRIHLFEWGSGNRVVILQHGWSSRGLQLYAIAQGFLAKGYKVVAFDSPAHGRSSGRKTDLIVMAQVLQDISNRYQNVEAIVAHSIGGAVSLYAHAQGMALPKLVTIATPALSSWVLSDFVKIIGGNQRVEQYILDYIKNKYDQDFDDISAARMASGLKPNTDMLIIHDQHDKQVGVKHAHELHAAIPQSQLHLTTKLGHNHILRDSATIAQIIHFVCECPVTAEEIDSKAQVV